MRRLGLVFTIIMASVALGWSAAIAQVATEARAVVELFTSQGCSSCPPADKLAGELAEDKSLIVLSLPVDYWDYLGWRDTLARPRHAARQRGYASVRGDRKVYTPQVVVNGLSHALGSDRFAIEAAIARTRTESAVFSIGVGLALDEDQLSVDIKPKKDQEAVAEVWLLAIARAIPIAVKSGDNKGKTLTYHNVVRNWINLGLWTGGRQSWSVPYSEFSSPEIDSVTVIVQAGGSEKPGAILGAARASLHRTGAGR